MISMTPVRFFSAMTVVVALTSGAAGALSSSATKTDLEAALAKHGELPHVPTSDSLTALEKSDVAQDTRLNQAEGGVAALRARIDFLMYEAMSTPRRQRSSRTAAARVRKEAVERGETGDPLQGVEGL